MGQLVTDRIFRLEELQHIVILFLADYRIVVFPENLCCHFTHFRYLIIVTGEQDLYIHIMCSFTDLWLNCTAIPVL